MANHHRYPFRQTWGLTEQLRGADGARLTRVTVRLQPRAQGDAGEGVQRMQLSRALMLVPLVRLLTLNINQVRGPSVTLEATGRGIVRTDRAEEVEGWFARAIVGAETLSGHAPWLFRRPIVWLQDTHRARVITEPMAETASISRYPDLTRLGISAEGAGAVGLITIIRAKCAATGAAEEGALALGGLTRSTVLAVRIPSMPAATRH
jgi:hypothetical protein